MPTALVQLPADWWAIEDVCAYLASQGRPIGARTWSGYVTRGQAPAAARHFGRTPVWAPVTVKTWNGARRGRGWRAGERRAAHHGQA